MSVSCGWENLNAVGIVYVLATGSLPFASPETVNAEVRVGWCPVCCDLMTMAS